MKFKADEIASVIQKEIDQFKTQVDVRDVGTVLEVGDGIARVYGLSGVMAGEMVEFPSGVIGLAFNLEENSVNPNMSPHELILQPYSKPRRFQHVDTANVAFPSSHAAASVLV